MSTNNYKQEKYSNSPEMRGSLNKTLIKADIQRNSTRATSKEKRDNFFDTEKAEEYRKEDEKRKFYAEQKLSVFKPRTCLPSINNVGFEANATMSCTPFYKIIDMCNTSAKFYSRRKLRKKYECPSSPSKRICKFSASGSPPHRFRVSCRMDICGNNAVSVWTIDSKFGIIKRQEIYDNKHDLKNGVMKAAFYCLQNGFDFMILSCSKFGSTGKEELVQNLLLLPPNIKAGQNRGKGQFQDEAVPKEGPRIVSEKLESSGKKLTLNNKPNINIVVLDSLSRSHFLRVLPKTVSEFQRINAAEKIKMKILDFELFQSIAPFTFPNVESFMAGRQDYVDIRTRKIDFSVLLKRYKAAGYRTMMQEDACWLDKWGTLMTSNRKREKHIFKKHELKREWKLIQKDKRQQFVDSYGLSHFSCYALQQYGKTNLFNSGDFCFDGKPLSAHFLDNVAEILTKAESTPRARPQFTYTHLNIAHETTGRRVISLDGYLSEFVRKVSSLNNTLTIFWSDHGAKTTKYAIRTLAGKFEIYDAFLFLAVPENIFERLGEIGTRNLIRNQRAILSAQDLHNTMLFLSSWNTSIGESTDHGLFTDHSSRSGCEELPIRPNALCKCSNQYKIVNLEKRKNYFDILWLSEFAIGELNNRLNKELNTRNNEYQASRSCKWLQGVSYRDVIHEQKKAKSRFVFDVFVNHTKIQVFNVQVLKHRSEQLQLVGWQRTSLYQSFDNCRDKNVSVQLCICSKKSKESIDAVLTSGMFGSANTLHYVATNPCLVSVVRNHQGEVKTYLIGNICKSRQNVSVSVVQSDGWSSSNSTPRKLTVVGLTVKFVTTARRTRINAPEYLIRFE